MDGDSCFPERVALGEIHVDVVVLGWDDEAQALVNSRVFEMPVCSML
jgi:hypothetical protein